MAAADAIAEKVWKSNPIDNVRYYHDKGGRSVDQKNYKSVLIDESFFWNKPIQKSVWLTKDLMTKKADFKIISIKNDSEIKLPTSLVQKLESPIKESLYILDLQDNWDGENSKAYSIESWKAGVQFTIDFYSWLSKIYSGKFYVPKIYHGPNGTIDLVWRENDFRLFINIDSSKNSGSYYRDRSSGQSTEGIFPSLDDVDFQLVIPPIQF